MTMLQIAAFIRSEFFEITIVDKQLVTGGNIDFITIKSDPPKPAVRATPIPVNLVCIPVDMLLTGLVLEINGVDTAMAFALLAATDNRCSN
jgi:hypothetical protein